MNFSIIDTTLREGEQFADATFDSATKISIAKALDAFGVDYIELTSPVASAQSRADCEAICRLGLERSKILTHVRCTMEDAKAAVETGVDGVNLVIGTSSFLRTFSHGIKDTSAIAARASAVIEYLQTQRCTRTGKPLEIRFSSEDAFRSELNDILSLYRAVNAVGNGIQRVGVADTVGCATPRRVYDVVRTVRETVGEECGIEIHLHNDTGMAIANAYTAIEAGATHIDTTVLGIGERNGITSLGGLIACLYASSPEQAAALKNKYNLTLLPQLERLVAQAVGVAVPWMNPVTSPYAFVHKPGPYDAFEGVVAQPESAHLFRRADFGIVETENAVMQRLPVEIAV
ncbi:Pyruvate carboxyltransferase domain-containing protein [Mycena chlorophos]|uniref:Pyruvate carboxyltransferase domain-containing protein n=1 Tax=Mycena chlorophos TaxID=658473 RepID=A0A8H6S7G2_MYCCL|nr:Pyruvate carboxyltransferase domain-containing protein [Mycena chlorophos]